jgi:hypothetical protein
MPNVEKLLDILKLVMPWLTGGVVGALLGFALNRRVARRREARLVIRTSVARFSIDGNSSLGDKLRVSYDGRDYENLSLCECIISNPSNRTIEDVVVVYEFDREARRVGEPVVDRTPVPVPHQLSTKDLPAHMLRCSLGTLDREAVAHCRFLVDGSAFLRAHVKAKDDPEIAHIGGVDGDDGPDRLVLLSGAYAALFVLAGAFPLIGEVLQAATIILFLPTLRRLAETVRALKFRDTRHNYSVYVERQVVGEAAIGIQVSDGRSNSTGAAESRRIPSAVAQHEVLEPG